MVWKMSVNIRLGVADDIDIADKRLFYGLGDLKQPLLSKLGKEKLIGPK
mgnify:CR=1 FL=1